MGIEPSRLKLEFASAAEGAAYAAIINDYTNEMTKLGHLELTDEQKEELVTLRDKRTLPKKKGKAASAAATDARENTASE